MSAKLIPIIILSILLHLSMCRSIPLSERKVHYFSQKDITDINYVKEKFQKQFRHPVYYQIQEKENGFYGSAEYQCEGIRLHEYDDIIYIINFHYNFQIQQNKLFSSFSNIQYRELVFHPRRGRIENMYPVDRELLDAIDKKCLKPLHDLVTQK